MSSTVSKNKLGSPVPKDGHSTAPLKVPAKVVHGEELPGCTKAHDAEQDRFEDPDDPCNDSVH